MADTDRVRFNLQPASGSGAAQSEKRRAIARRFTRPTGQNQRRKRTQNWIKPGGKVNATMIASSSRVSTVDFASLGPVGRSATDIRLRHFATVF